MILGREVHLEGAMATSSILVGNPWTEEPVDCSGRCRSQTRLKLTPCIHCNRGRDDCEEDLAWMQLTVTSRLSSVKAVRVPHPGVRQGPGSLALQKRISQAESNETSVYQEEKRV